MGCEDFQVLLRSKKFCFDQVSYFFSEHPKIILKEEPYYEYRDDKHVVELEVRSGKGVEVSLRFALCNPATVDDVFLDLINELSDKFSFDLKVMDSNDQRVSQIKNGIDYKRNLWIKDFGDEIAALGCDEAINRFILNAK